MLYYPHLIAGLVGFFTTLAVRSFTLNGLIRRKLRLSLAALAAYVVIDLFASRPGAAADLAARLQSIQDLLFALALINLLVVVVINPLRADRIPEHFPNIVQDAIIIGLFLVVATIVMQEKFLTTSAVGAVVIGFALQDTLGNTFAGLAIQVEKPFRVGQWITVGSFEGRVTEITWRATKLRTKSGNFVVLPNNMLSKEAITNYSAPEAATRLFVDIGASYEVPPNDVKAAIRDALADAPLVLDSPAPAIVLADFGASAITYRVKFWVGDYADDDPARDQVRTAVYYTFRRRGIEIPFPIQVQYSREEAGARAPDRTSQLADMLERVDILAPLETAAREALAAAAEERLYGAGQAVVRQGDPGSSMFIISRGEVRVTVGAGQEVARIGPGGYFGEMSLLTGDPRTATVTAVDDCLVLEITAETFRRIALAHPIVVEQVTMAVQARREELERAARTAATTITVAEAPRSFLARVQQFLGLPTRDAGRSG